MNRPARDHIKKKDNNIPIILLLPEIWLQTATLLYFNFEIDFKI